MKLGIMSDTHQDKANAIPHIMREFAKRKVDLIIHCGDIIKSHINSSTFRSGVIDFPVIVAFTNEQEGEGKEKGIERFFNIPPDWTYTLPNNRFVKISDFKAYIGHKRSTDYSSKAWDELRSFLQETRDNHDNVRWVFAGHTHHQFYLENPLISVINPGAVEDSFGSAGGYEFATVDTKTGEVVFSRILYPMPISPEVKIGIISETKCISRKDPGYWKKISNIFQENGVSYIIHCGNISVDDLGRPEFEGFKEVIYYLRDDQIVPSNKTKEIPSNWKKIDLNKPIAEIEGYILYIDPLFGLEIFKLSERELYTNIRGMQKKCPEAQYVLCGSSHNAFLGEMQNVMVINPGDAVNDQDYVILDLPKNEITFSRVPMEPLPSLS